MDLVIKGPNPVGFRWQLRAEPSQQAAEDFADELVAAIASMRKLTPPDDIDVQAQLWLPHVSDSAHETATKLGFSDYRDLWQLRATLPLLSPAGTPHHTTPFAVDLDLDDFVAVNSRAFAWHPEQGQLTADDIRRTMQEPWFDPVGFRMLRIDGKLAGFCWTKIHRDAVPALGEIYVIAIDPEFHGQGLGGPMTQAGLDYLQASGLTTAMLYVESDNDAANRVYSRLGFTRHHTDRAYALTLS